MTKLNGASRWRTKCGNCAHFKQGGKFGTAPCESFGNGEDSRSCSMWEPDLSRMRLPVMTLIRLIRDLNAKDFAKFESYAVGTMWKVPTNQQQCDSCYWWKQNYRGNSCQQVGVKGDQHCMAWAWNHKQAREHLKDAVAIYDNLLPAEKPALHIIICREQESRNSRTTFHHGDDVIYEVPSRNIKTRVTVMAFPKSADEGATPMVRVLTRTGKIWTVLSETIRYPRQQKGT